MDVFPLGGIVTLFVLLPNLLAALFPPQDSLPPAAGTLLARLTVLERVGQVSSFVLPFFYPIRPQGALFWAALAVMLVALGLYYAGWARYLQKGRREVFFYRPLLGIPLPMALMPVIYFFAAGGLLRSPWLALAAVGLGVGHIGVTRLNARRFEPTNEPGG